MFGIFSWKVLKVAWPVCLGYLPMGLACGMFAQKAGLTLWEVLGMCFILYAGSGQFITIAMIMQSASIFSIGLTIFVVNLRHFLFSSTLIRYLQGKSPWFLAFYGYEITDESFAVNLASFEQGGWTPEDARRLNTLSHSSWILSNAAGFLGGELLSVDTQLVGYALTSMFIGLWSFYLDKHFMLITGLLAGVLAVLLSMVVDYRLHIVLATVLAAAGAAWFEQRGAREVGR